MSIFLRNLKKSGHLNTIHMTVCNVGSRKLGERDDYASQEWGVFAPQLSIYGFDADADACEAANADLEARQISWTEKHIPLALGNSEGEFPLYVTKHPMCSSLYLPNEPYLARFAGLSELMNLDFTIEIETTTLDNFCRSEELEEIDFLQVDVQGADLHVLEGAAQILSRSVLGVQIEVEFSHLYAEQPLFADVDTFLRKQEFTMFDLGVAYRLRSDSPIRSNVRSGQLLWGDAFYFRDLIASHSNSLLKTPEKILKLACIADIMNFPDYALELLEYLTLEYGKDPQYNCANNIVESLAQFPELVTQGLGSLPVVSRIKDYITGYNTNLFGFSVVPPEPKILSSVDVFHSVYHLQHTQRRLEHLATLGLDIGGKTVLEVGAGIGDHTNFFLDRGCKVLTTEGRKENLEILRTRYPEIEVKPLDLDNPDPKINWLFDIVYCYGILYHLQKPAEAIAFLSHRCENLLLLETCVSFGEEESVNFCAEEADFPTQSISGQGCRPTRKWVYNQLKQHFAFVYLPITQPNSEEFPLDWSVTPSTELTRCVFIASRHSLNNPLLIEEIPMKQQRH